MQKVARDRAISIEIGEIGLEPGPFCMSYHFNTHTLKRSLERFGLWSPVFVVNSGEEGIQPVIGYRRIHALRALKERVVECVDLTDSRLSRFDLFLLNFYDNLTTRTFNDVEKAMILSRLSRYLTEDQITETYMPMLQLPTRKETLQLFLRIEGLEEPLKRSVATGAVSLKALDLLMELDGVSRNALSHLFSGLKFSFNNQIQFIEYMIEIRTIEGLSIPELMSDAAIQETLQDRRMNQPQKVKMLMAYLKSRRYPTLSRYKDAFRQQVSKLPLPDGVTLRHAPYFETSDMSLEIVFREGRGLKKRLKALLDLKGLDKIEKALNGEP